MRLELGSSGGFQHGVFFDVLGKQTCQITSMWVLADGPATLTIRTCVGGWEAAAKDPSMWLTRGQVYVPQKSEGEENPEETELFIKPPILLEPGEQVGLYLHGPSQYAVAFTSSSRVPEILESPYLTATRGRHTRSPTPFEGIWSGATFYFPAGALEVSALASQAEVRSELQELATDMKSENAALKSDLAELRASMEQLRTENVALQDIRADLDKLKAENAALAAELREERAGKLQEAQRGLQDAEAELSKKQEALSKLKEVVALGVTVPLDEALKQCEEAEEQVQYFRRTFGAEKDRTLSLSF